jgi:hypothetical protein
MFGVPWSNCHCKASITGPEGELSWQMHAADSDSNQVLEALVRVHQVLLCTLGHFSTVYPEIEDYPPQFEDSNEQMAVLKRFKSVFYDSNVDYEFAGKANPRPEFIINSDLESGLLVVNCGVTTMLTDSFFNMMDVKPKVIIFQMAGDGATL